MGSQYRFFPQLLGGDRGKRGEHDQGGLQNMDPNHKLMI